MSIKTDEMRALLNKINVVPDTSTPGLQAKVDVPKSLLMQSAKKPADVKANKLIKE